MSNPAKPAWAFSLLVAALLCWCRRCCHHRARRRTLAQLGSVRLIITLSVRERVDIGARLFADKLSATLGPTGRRRESSRAATAWSPSPASSSANDDHVLLVSPVSSFTAHPYFHDKLPYDPTRSHSDRPYHEDRGRGERRNVAQRQLTERARSAGATKPGQLNWTTATGFTDFVFAGYLHSVGLKMAKVPYKNPVGAVDRSRSRRDSGLHAGLRDRAARRWKPATVKVLAVTQSRTRARSFRISRPRSKRAYPSLATRRVGRDCLVRRELRTSVRTKVADGRQRGGAADPEIVRRSDGYRTNRGPGQRHRIRGLDCTTAATGTGRRRREIVRATKPVQ
mgnify:CR=1 FL=1